MNEPPLFFLLSEDGWPSQREAQAEQTAALSVVARRVVRFLRFEGTCGD